MNKIIKNFKEKKFFILFAILVSWIVLFFTNTLDIISMMGTFLLTPILYIGLSILLDKPNEVRKTKCQ